MGLERGVQVRIYPRHAIPAILRVVVKVVEASIR